MNLRVVERTQVACRRAVVEKRTRRCRSEKSDLLADANRGIDFATGRESVDRTDEIPSSQLFEDDSLKTFVVPLVNLTPNREVVSATMPMFNLKGSGLSPIQKRTQCHYQKKTLHEIFPRWQSTAGSRCHVSPPGAR